MKLQAIEIPIGKNHTNIRRKSPKIAPVVALSLFLLILIPVYYPLLRNPQKNSSESSSSSYVSLQESIIATPTSDDASVPDDEPKRQSSLDHGDMVAPDKKEHLETSHHHPDKDAKRPPSPNNNEDLVVLHRPSKKERNSKRSSRSSKKGKGKRLSSPSGNRDIIVTAPPQSEKRQESPRKEKLVGPTLRRVPENGKCDIFSGEWVPNPEGPYYTNTTCWAIQEHQNCMKFGKPNGEFMTKWKWKPDGCELPIFDPVQFLEIVRGKSIAFVGDSVARNHMQSLICLLSRVEDPIDVSSSPNQQTRRYEYRNHNFTVAIFWSPYLVRTAKSDPNDTTQTRPFNLYLDEFDEEWTTQIADFDHVIISAGHWFFRPTNFYVGGRLAGCLYCPQSNVTHLSMYFSYRRAFRTAFRAINGLQDYKGTTFLRTFAPSHFENGIWNEGGDCQRARPFKNTEARLDGYNLELYAIQVEELRIAERIGRKKGLRFRLLDVTQAMLLRPDGHPSKFGHVPRANVSLYNDCVHWCLPGPIDSWNDFLLKMLDMEGT